MADERAPMAAAAAAVAVADKPDIPTYLEHVIETPGAKPSTRSGRYQYLLDTVRRRLPPDFMDGMRILGLARSPLEILEIARAGQCTAAWHRARERIITASRFAAVLGRSPYPGDGKASTLELIRSGKDKVMTGRALIATTHGKKMEGVARDAYWRRVLAHRDARFAVSEDDCVPFECGLLVMQELPMFGASPDWLVTKHGALLYVVEIKCPFSRRYEGVPEEYRLQMILQCCVFDVPRAHFFRYGPGAGNEQLCGFDLDIDEAAKLLADAAADYWASVATPLLLEKAVPLPPLSRRPELVTAYDLLVARNSEAKARVRPAVALRGTLRTPFRSSGRGGRRPFRMPRKVTRGPPFVPEDEDVEEHGANDDLPPLEDDAVPRSPS